MRSVPLQSLKASALLSLYFLLMTSAAWGQTFHYSRASGNWTDTNTWSLTSGGTSCNCIPAAGDAVFIENGFTVTSIAAGDLAANLFINILGTSTLTLQNGNTNAMAGLFNSSGSTINIAAGTLNLAATTTFNGTVRNQGGTFPANPALTFANGSTYIHARNGGTIPTATWRANSTVSVTGLSNAMPDGWEGQTFGNLTWNCVSQSSRLAFNANFSVVGTWSVLSTGPAPNDLLIVSGTTPDISSTITVNNFVQTGDSRFGLATTALNSTGTLVVLGNFSQSGTGWLSTGGASAGTANSNLVFAGTANQSLSIANFAVGLDYIFRIRVNKPSGSVQLLNSITIPSVPADNIFLDIQSGTFTVNSGVSFSTGAVQGTTPGTLEVNGTLILRGINNTFNGNLIPSGFIRYTNGNPLIFAPSTGSYNNLVLAGNGTATLNGSITVNNITVPGANVSVVFGTSPAKTLTVNGDIPAGGTIGFDMRGAAHILNLNGGTNAVSSLTTDANNSRVVYGRNGDQQVFGSLNYRNLEITGGGIKSLSAQVSVANALALTNGRFQLGNNALTYAGTEANLTRTNGWIETNNFGFFMRNAAGSNFTFPVGTATQYQPVVLGTSGVNATVRFRTGSAGLPAGNVGSWFISNSASSYTVSFENPQGGSLVWGTSTVRRFTGSTWLEIVTNYPNSNVYVTESLSLTGVNEFAIAPIGLNFFTIGNAQWDQNTGWSTNGSSACGCNPAGVSGATVSIRSNHTVTVAAAADIATNNTIDIAGTGTLTLNNGNTNPIAALSTSAGSTINIASGTLNLATATTFNGTVTVSNTGTLPNGMTFANGATYIHARNGGSIPTATWGASSECRITGITNSSFAIGAGFLAQNFGNFTWDCAGQTVPQVFNINLVVQNTSAILNTGTGSITLATGNNFTWTSQHFILNPSAGNTVRFQFANGPQQGTLRISGNLNNAITPAGTVEFGLFSTGSNSAVIEMVGNSNTQIFNPPNNNFNGVNPFTVRINKTGTPNDARLVKNFSITQGNSGLDIQQGIFIVEANRTLNLSNLAGDGMLTLGNTSTLNLQETVSFTGILNADVSSIINYNGISPQNIFTPSSGGYGNLILTNANTKTLLGNISVAGNFTNNGATLAGNHTVTFSGTAAQSIGGSSNTTFFGLTINKTSNVLNINNPIAVSNALSLSNGRLVLGNNNLTYTGTEANLNRTNAWIETNGTGAFARTGVPATANNFYVGDATAMRNVILSNFSSGTSVRFSPVITPNISGTNPAAGMWVLNGSGAGNITLQNVGGTANGSSQIFRSDAGGDWTDVATNPPSLLDFTSVGTIPLASDQRFTVFSLAVGTTPQSITFRTELLTRAVGDPPFRLEAVASSGLPVSFSSSNSEVATITEIDGTFFVNINGAGRTEITASQAGGSGFAAAESVSKNLLVIVSGNESAASLATQLYPNPASREVELVPALLYGAVQYRLQSAQGHTLWQAHRGDVLPFRFSVEALPKGIYFLHIQNAQESFVKKIVKE